jgi:hypothetical protein
LSGNLLKLYFFHSYVYIYHQAILIFIIFNDFVNVRPTMRMVWCDVNCSPSLRTLYMQRHIYIHFLLTKKSSSPSSPSPYPHSPNYEHHRYFCRFIAHFLSICVMCIVYKAKQRIIITIKLTEKKSFLFTEFSLEIFNLTRVKSVSSLPISLKCVALANPSEGGAHN